MTFIQQTHIYIFIKHMSTISRTLQVNNGESKKQMFFSSWEINASKFGSKNEISYKIIYHQMTSYGYLFMILVDSCIIWFHLDCIMQLKESYYIATNVSSRNVLLLLVISLTVNHIHCLLLLQCRTPVVDIHALLWLSRKQRSRGQHRAHLGPVGPRWAPCRPNEPCSHGIGYCSSYI